MGLGGPVWHASAAPYPVTSFVIRDTLESWAELAIAGVGDAMLGEWHEWTGKAVHIRRRLSALEQQRVGPVVDIRTDSIEVDRRMRPIRHLLPVGWSE